MRHYINATDTTHYHVGKHNTAKHYAFEKYALAFVMAVSLLIMATA